jgi:haloacetate dehalogenase
VLDGFRDERVDVGPVRLRVRHGGEGRQVLLIHGHPRTPDSSRPARARPPERVSRLVVLDAIPIIEHLDRCDARFARAWYHWFFFDVPDKPERAINADPLAWYDNDPQRMGGDHHAEWVEAVTHPDTVRAMLEDYRAGLGIDAEHERVDRAGGRLITCPTLVLWSSHDDLAALHGNPLTIWRSWCSDLTGATIDSRHHIAEDNPEDLSTALTDFLESPPS